MKKIRVLLIEDNRILREGILTLLKKHQGIKAVGAVGNADTLLKARGSKPHVVLLDIGLPGQNGTHLVHRIKEEIPQTSVIVMGLVPVESDIHEFVRAGASGFILKDATPGDFVRTIRAVAGGLRTLPSHLTGTLFSQIVQHAVRKGRRKLSESLRMTKREREITALIADGLSNKEIAQRLNVAVDTVKSHVHNILDKLALHTRLEVASYIHTDETL